MSRPLRIQYPGAYYHVMNRGISRACIFDIDDDYGMFMAILEETSKYFGVKVIAYCLMTNHYHLLIHTPKGNLSRAMRHLSGVYTQRYNRLHKKDGPLFRGRYRAILIQEDEYLTHLIRYIHLNPIQANLVADLTKYPHTSHHDYLKGKDRALWLSVRHGLAFFAPKLKESLLAYRMFLKDGIDPRTLSFYNKTNQSSILGDVDFIEDIRNKYLLADEKIDTEISEERSLAGEGVVERIIKEVSTSFKVNPKVIYLSRRGCVNYPRFAALYLSRELSGLTLTQIAGLFKISTYRTVGTSCYRFKNLLDRDLGLKRQYEMLKGRCSQGKI